MNRKQTAKVNLWRFFSFYKKKRALFFDENGLGGVGEFYALLLKGVLDREIY